MASTTFICKYKGTSVSQMIRREGCLCWHHVTCNMMDNQHKYFSGDGLPLYFQSGRKKQRQGPATIQR